MDTNELGDIDLGFRPKSYFWPLGLETHLLSRIKGAERKAALKQLIDSGNLEGIPDFLAESALSEDERKTMGRIHPAFMGGEYLPDLRPNEVMVARITIASTTQDVIWQVRTVSGRNTLFYRFNGHGGRIEAHAEGTVPDACLRPVSGLADDDTARAALGNRKSRSETTHHRRCLSGGRGVRPCQSAK